ncbi:MAG: LysR family transcriptional regulator [Pseudomonadales bacterium]|nr:LysR family transcriptional regulator [Pseudomonadales bacterium]
MNLRKIDLNLLVVFNVLMQERSITRSADKLSMSQPAVSHALSRLRLQLQDPLLTRSGNTMQASPRAMEIHGLLKESLQLLEQSLDENTVFIPAESAATFTIATTDYVETLLLPKILRKLNEQAPGIQLIIRNLSSSLPFDDIESGDSDLVLCRVGKHPKSLRTKKLLEDRFLCAMSHSNPLTGKNLTLQRYLKAEHLLVAPESKRKAIVDKVLQQQGSKRKIAATVPHFLVALPAVTETNLIVTAPARLLERMEKHYNLHITEVPLPLEPFSISMLWHRRNDADKGLEWIRQCILDIVKTEEAVVSH